MEANLTKAKKWLSNIFDEETRTEVQQLIDTNAEDLTDRFYKDTEFGTGGMRGIMGAGTNRINKYTLGKATQGLSNYFHEPKRTWKAKAGAQEAHEAIRPTDFYKIQSRTHDQPVL